MSDCSKHASVKGNLRVSSDKPKKVLMVTRAFPPENGSAVYRPMKFAKFLPDYRWKPYIVTTRKNVEPLDYTLIKDIAEGVSVHEVFSPEPANLNSILKKRYKHRSRGRVRYAVLKTLLKMYSIFYYRAVIVDWHDGWVPFGFLEARRIVNKEDIDLVFVDMEPPSSSIIGLLLKKVTGKPLVIDYHDPWTTSVDAKHRKGMRKRIAECLEHKIVRLADKVTAGKMVVISEIMKTFTDVDNQKFMTITSGYDPADFTGLTRRKRSEFVITYTGKISEKFYYSPESFLYALGELIEEKKIPRNDVVVNFLGTVSVNYQCRFQRLLRDMGLEGVVLTTGSVDHKRCAEYQINSDILLYIIESVKGRDVSYEFSGALPSKLYEYLYTGNPILAIVPPGFEADLIHKTGTGFVVEPNNVAAVKVLLYELYTRHKEGSLRIDSNQEEIGKYSRKTLTGQLAAVFDEVLAEVNDMKEMRSQ